MKTFIIFDISNLLYRTFFANTSQDDTTIAGLATHMALMTLNKYFKQLKPHKVIMAFDRNSWRKEYTASEQCLSQRPYKGNRRKDMSPAQRLKYQRFLGHLQEFESLITNHSSIIALAADRLEADDVIAGFVQKHLDDQIIIVSSDGDMLQLLKYPNVRIITPENGKDRTLEEYDNDPKYFLFQKCLRGDSTDNVQSAFPRIGKIRIKKAYTDPFEYVQVMKTSWKMVDGREVRVEKMYQENQLLIDLEKQPKDIRQLIDDCIETAMNKQHKFSHFHLMKYLGKYKLEKIAASIDQFIPLLSR